MKRTEKLDIQEENLRKELNLSVEEFIEKRDNLLKQMFGRTKQEMLDAEKKYFEKVKKIVSRRINRII